MELGSFSMEVESVELCLLKRQIIVKEIELIDSSGLAKLAASEATFKHIRIFPLLFANRLIVGEAHVMNPDLLVSNRFLKKVPSKKEKTKEKKGREIRIRKIEIEDAKLLISKSDLQQADTLYFTQFDVGLWNFSQNGDLGKYIFQTTSFDRLWFSLRRGKLNFTDDLYSFRYNELDYNSDKSSLRADSLQLVSLHSKYEIGRLRGVETDWFDFMVQDFTVKGIRLNDLLQNSAFIAEEARIKDLSGLAFKDRRLPFPEKSDTKLPMQMLSDLSFGMHCTSFFIDHAKIEYAERVDDSDQPGKVSFYDLQAQIENLSTIDSLISQPTTMKARAKVMNEAWLKANFVFPNKKYPKAYRVYGEMESISLASFNPILKQNAFVVVKRGISKSIFFDFEYNNDKSNGEFFFEYSDLKISILDKDDYHEKNVQSFIVNSLLLHEENVKGDLSFRKGTIGFKRDKKKSIFNFWWKSILSGLKSIAIL